MMKLKVGDMLCHVRMIRENSQLTSYYNILNDEGAVEV